MFIFLSFRFLYFFLFAEILAQAGYVCQFHRLFDLFYLSKINIQLGCFQGIWTESWVREPADPIKLLWVRPRCPGIIKIPQFSSIISALYIYFYLRILLLHREEIYFKFYRSRWNSLGPFTR